MVKKEEFKFGKFIKKKREEKRYSMRQLAMLSGLSVSYISLLERGLRELPKVPTLLKLAKPLDNITEDELQDLIHYIDKANNQEEENLFIFDLQGLSKEEIESVKRHIEELKQKADKKNKDDTY